MSDESAVLVRTVEQWERSARELPVWAKRAARVLNGWPVGKLLTEAEYLEGVQRAANCSAR